MQDSGMQFQLVVMDSPIENWKDPHIQEFFAKMVMLKKQGYEHCYPEGVLPVDTSDFLATHLLLCEKKSDGELIPVMGYKTVTLEKCRQFNQNFPGLSLVQNARMPEHVAVVEEIMQRCETTGRGLAYLGSWTVDPDFKKRAGSRVNLKEAFTAFYRLLYHEQKVAEVIIGGTLRFKTEKLFADLGHSPLTKNGQVLSSIRVVHLVKEPVLVMHSQEFSVSSREAEMNWQNIWNERIYVGKKDQEQKLKSVA